MIKSGGEWISSVELENQVMAHPEVFEAAVVAIPDERWSERPLVCVVATPGEAGPRPPSWSRSSSRASRGGGCRTSWAFIEAVPKTSVGKFDKKVLRAQYAKGELDVVIARPPRA